MQTRNFEFSNFAIEYLSLKQNETVFACLYGAQGESFKQINCQKSRYTVPLTIQCTKISFLNFEHFCDLS